MLSNANIIATIAGLRIMLGDILEGDHFEHTYIAYLPLAVRLSLGFCSCFD